MPDLEEKLFELLKNPYSRDLEILHLLRDPKLDVSATHPEATGERQGWTIVHYVLEYALANSRKVILNYIFDDLRFPLSYPPSLKEAFAKNFTLLSELAERRDNAIEKAKIEFYKKQLEQYNARVAETLKEENARGVYNAGIVFTKNLSLKFKSAHNSGKDCNIPHPISSELNLSAPDERAIIEAIIVQNWWRNHYKRSEIKMVEDLEGFSRTPGLTNYLLVNIGCVISEGKYEKDKNQPQHRRKFITAPISFNIKDKHKINSKQHSEDYLVNNFLSDSKNVEEIITSLLKVHGIEIESLKNDPRKIYAIVFDMHSSYDVCDECEKKLFDFEQKNQLTQQLSDMKVFVHNKKNIKILFRVSSARKWNKTPPEKRNENLFLARKDDENRKKIFDLKKSAIPLILHTDETFHQEITDPSHPSYPTYYHAKKYNNLGLFKLPRYTIFQNDIGVNEHISYPEEFGVSWPKGFCSV